jgi:hypothetical protein
LTGRQAWCTYTGVLGGGHDPVFLISREEDESGAGDDVLISSWSSLRIAESACVGENDLRGERGTLKPARGMASRLLVTRTG